MISIIIPTYNGQDKLKGLVTSLTEQTFQDFETIFVIDGSTDNSEELLNSLSGQLVNCKIVKRANGGRSKARNSGVSEASGDLLLFFDDDMRPVPEVVSRHISHHEKFEDSILVGNQLENIAKCTTDIQKYKAQLSRKWMNNLAQTQKKLNHPFITAAHFSISKKLFLKLGGFDEELTDTEDYDLAVRAIKESIPIYFKKEIIAWHDDLITCKSYILRQREYTKSALLLYHYKKEEAYEPDVPKVNFLKRPLFRFFSSKVWVQRIDNDELTWLPKLIRYKIYGLVITGLGSIFQEKKL